MNFQKIAKFCKQSREIHFYDGGDLQWIGDGRVLYPIIGLPWMTEENIITLLGLTDKQRDEMMFHAGAIPPEISVADSVPAENLLPLAAMDFALSDAIVRPLVTAAGIAFIDTKYLSIFSGINGIELYDRIASDGEPYIIAKLGLMVRAIIFPCAPISGPFIDFLESLLRLCKNKAYEGASRSDDI